MLSLAPELTREQAKQIIIQSCKKIGNQTDYQNNISEKYGNGLLMANNIIQNTLAFNKKRIIMDTAKTIGKGYALHIGINFVDTNFWKSCSCIRWLGCGYGEYGKMARQCNLIRKHYK
ncbi:MAG: hypothetical protein IPI65_08370 [Bacteroidetes bacterium]|nr:hypothetical protein [Bacteroidota bacterium]